MNELYLPDNRLVAPDGHFFAPLASRGPVGLDLYEAPEGGTALEALAAITQMRNRRERTGTLLVAPGEASAGLLIEVAIFNAEAHQGRELSDRDKEILAAAVKKRIRRQKRNRRP